MNLMGEGITELPIDSARELQEDPDQYSDSIKCYGGRDYHRNWTNLWRALASSTNTLPYKHLSPSLTKDPMATWTVFQQLWGVRI